MRLESGQAVLIWIVGCLTLGAVPAVANWGFTDITLQAGFDYSHGWQGGVQGCIDTLAGGVAVGDYDRDGWLDLYAVRGDVGPGLLFRNRGDGTFEEVGATAGVALTGPYVGPVFADYDGDGWLDLLLGAKTNGVVRVFRNQADGTFVDTSFASGLLPQSHQTWSGAFGDYDLDGDLDLALGHWTYAVTVTANHLWRNEGNGTFVPVDTIAGITGYDVTDFSFTPNFADINDDGWPDLLMAADFGTSRVFVNNGNGTFTDATTPVISDENGMGAAVGDYDNDGDLDWFVTAIEIPAASSTFDSSIDADTTSGGSSAEIARGAPSPDDEREPQAFTGNRLYCNQGGGTFADCTLDAKVRTGYWGWAASFQDFDNDADLDLFHVNGYYGSNEDDPSRMFVSDGNGVFTESAIALGINDYPDSRGVACFDFDRDGDLDIFIANNSEPPTFYRNDGGNDLGWLTVKLAGPGANTEGVGSRVYVTVGGTTQMREIRAGSNYSSQDPAEAHFGIGTATQVDELRVEWLAGGTTVLTNVAADRFLTLCDTPGGNTPDSDGDGAGDGCDSCPGAPNPGQGPARFPFTVTAASATSFEWLDPVAHRYVRGTFGAAADIGQLAPSVDSTGSGSSLTVGDTPPPGTGYWFLVQVDCGSSSWSSGGASERHGRDSALP